MKVQAEKISLAGSSLSCPQAPTLSVGHQRLIFRMWLVLTDALVLGLAFGIAYFLRFHLQMTISPEVVPDPRFYPGLAMCLVALWIVMFVPFGLYDLHLLLGGVQEYSRIFNSCTTGTMMVVVSTFIFPRFVVSRGWLISAWLLSFTLVALNRFATRRIAYALREQGYLLTPAVIIGTNQEALTLANDLSEWRTSGLRIVGFVSSENRAEMTGRGSAERPVLESTSKILSVIKQHEIEDLVVAITAVDREELLQLCEEVNSLPGIHLRLSSGLYELLTTRVTVKTLGLVPLMSLNKVRLKPGETYVKSVLEYSLALFGLLLLSPLFLGLVLLIRLDSPGPVLFRRRVLGVSGKEFDAFKFRTMHVNGDHVLKQSPELARQLRDNHKLKQDPRVTRVGRWLRKYSLDELPQLFNVLLGQMGLVGPRMISPEEAEKYGRHKLNLLTVKPGITGLWQVSGRSDLSYDERVRLDMFYVRNYSVWLDLQILFVQTLPTVLKGHGAY
jgi:exopolysaccharide biosynthesis polyprenyl glycosylphosphotransferase